MQQHQKKLAWNTSAQQASYHEPTCSLRAGIRFTSSPLQCAHSLVPFMPQITFPVPMRVAFSISGTLHISTQPTKSKLAEVEQMVFALFLPFLFFLVLFSFSFSFFLIFLFLLFLLLPHLTLHFFLFCFFTKTCALCPKPQPSPGLHTTAREPKRAHLRAPAFQTPLFSTCIEWIRNRNSKTKIAHNSEPCRSRARDSVTTVTLHF